MANANSIVVPLTAGLGGAFGGLSAAVGGLSAGAIIEVNEPSDVHFVSDTGIYRESGADIQIGYHGQSVWGTVSWEDFGRSLAAS